MQAHLDAYAAAAARGGARRRPGGRRGDRRRRPGAGRAAVGRPLRRLLGVPGRQGRAGGVRPVGAGARDRRRSSASTIVPQAFLGEVRAGRRRRRRAAAGRRRCGVWWARLAGGAPVAHEHAALRWLRADELDDLELDRRRPPAAPRRPRPPRPPLNAPSGRAWAGVVRAVRGLQRPRCRNNTREAADSALRASSALQRGAGDLTGGLDRPSRRYDLRYRKSPLLSVPKARRRTPHPGGAASLRGGPT